MMHPLSIAPRLEIDQESLERGLLIVGDAFSDAEARLVLPLARRLIESGQTGLILDATGEIAPRLRSLYPDAVTLVGPASAARLNILDEVASMDLEAVFDASRRECYVGRESYWGSVAYSDVVLLRKYVSALERRTITLIDLYRLSSSEQYVLNIIYRLNEKSASLHRLLRNQPTSSAWRPDEGGQTMRDNTVWHYSFLRVLLDPVVRSPALLRAFCSQSRATKIDFLKQVVVLDLPRGYWGKSVDFIAGLLGRWYAARNPSGFLVTNGLAPIHAVERLGFGPVIASGYGADEQSLSRFGTNLFFATTQPKIIEWLSTVAGESIARGLASSARAGSGFGVFRYAASTAGLSTQAEFLVERDPLFAASSIFLRRTEHRALAMLTRELPAVVEKLPAGDWKERRSWFR